MKVTRYAGLPEEITKDDADKLLNGGFYFKSINNYINKYCFKIPVSDNNPVYQLGWSSIAYFTLNGTDFGSFDVKCPDPKRAEFIKEVPKNDEKISTVVTRGVCTCTAVAILRGNAMCLLHLDASDLTSFGLEIIDNIRLYLKTGNGDIFICASYINEEVEDTFVQGLIDTCQDTFTNSKITTNIIHRGIVDENLLTHLEFGIGVDENINLPIVFGDIYSNTGLNKFGYYADGSPIEEE